MTALLLLSLQLAADPSVAGEPDRLLQHVNERWTGDLDGMVERGFIRILTVHNPLFFTFHGLRQHGITADLARAFEDHLAEEMGRLRSPTAYGDTIEIIKRHADRYGFDGPLIAAQAYQESRLDQSRRSPSGAVGILQLLPSTAAGPAVGIHDISTVENNVHAGVRYLAWLRDEHFSSEEIEPLDRMLFCLAAYNAGPGSVARARRRARRLGFDPDRWFGHVEIGMYRAVSGEPAAYVRNVYKYYVTYRRLEEVRARQKEARREVR